MRKVEVVPHNPIWRQVFESESRDIASALGENVAAIYHIGSTAIPGIYAKPIIDCLVAVRAIAQVDGQNEAMARLEYESMGEFGIPGRRYFRKDNAAGIRTHHVHGFEVGSAHIERHLAFRDYMRAHPADALAYSNLKRQLAKAHANDIEAYIDGKDDFIQAMDAKAALWRSHRKIQSISPTTR
ncbi:MAG: GrpB family protein [Cyanobacteria bacterium P01_H01_bin.130]